VSQLFFDPAEFLAYEARVRSAGVEVPVIPGIIIINSAQGYDRVMQFCTTTKVPAGFARELDSCRDNAASVVALGIRHASEMCRVLYSAGVRAFHFYTLNNETSTRAVVSDLLSYHNAQMKPTVPRLCLDSAEEVRKEENVMPTIKTSPASNEVEPFF